jgi:radical SAM superfamily enzyme YgiQ (UPF0313 family)
MKTSSILLVSVNARYSHASYAIRTLRANLGALASVTSFLETDLEITPIQLAEQITKRNPRIVGFSIYLWNRLLIEATVGILRVTHPSIIIVAGGPECVVGESSHSDKLWDARIIGEGETTFRKMCDAIFAAPFMNKSNRSNVLPLMHTVTAPEDLSKLILPYDEYSDIDILQRTIYAETSRGCPYSCSYCTSDGTTLRLFPLKTLLPAFEKLWERGVRKFKFLDRSFNAPVEHACAILDFFLPRVTPGTCLHFEINPDHLHPDVFKRMAAFPKDALHLEVGLQTINPNVAKRIGRSVNTEHSLENLRKLCQETGAIVHADLIFGLPEEDEASFARGFNTVVETCQAPEVQVNWLKGLPGTRIVRDAAQLHLAFSTEPPYELLHSDVMDFDTLCRMQRFARCWELVHNRGHFPKEVKTLQHAIAPDFYKGYQLLAQRIFEGEGKLYAISAKRLHGYLQQHLDIEIS